MVKVVVMVCVCGDVGWGRGEVGWEGWKWFEKGVWKMEVEVRDLAYRLWMSTSQSTCRRSLGWGLMDNLQVGNEHVSEHM